MDSAEPNQSQIDAAKVLIAKIQQDFPSIDKICTSAHMVSDQNEMFLSANLSNNLRGKYGVNVSLRTAHVDTFGWGSDVLNQLGVSDLSPSRYPMLGNSISDAAFIQNVDSKLAILRDMNQVFGATPSGGRSAGEWDLLYFLDENYDQLSPTGKTLTTQLFAKYNWPPQVS